MTFEVMKFLPSFAAAFLRGLVFSITASVPLTCSAPAAIQAVTPDSYLPLRTGAEWTMDLVMIGPNGQELKGTGKRKVGDAVQRDGKTWFPVRTWAEGLPFKPDSSKLMRKDAKGFYSIDGRDPDGREQMEIALPLEVGQRWERSEGSRTLKEQVVGLETVTIGEKTYENCYHLRSESIDGSFQEDYWEAPGLGSVKSIILNGDGSKITLTLREFKPGPK